MSSAMSSSDPVIRNQFLRNVQSTWTKAYASAQFLPKDMAPVKLMHVALDQLVLDKSHYLSQKYKNQPTKFLVRIKGKGFRRIYKGFKVLGCKWDPVLALFIFGDYGDCNRFYFVEINREPIVVVFNFEHSVDIDDIPVQN